MRLWYYNRADDTEAKMNAIMALQYMVRQWLWTQPINTASQPKVTDFQAAWEDNNPLTNINYDTLDNLNTSWSAAGQKAMANWTLNVSWMQSIDVTNGIG